MYSQKVLEVTKNPMNFGVIEGADGVGEVGSGPCGDVTNIYIKLNNDVIEDCKFEAFGCIATIASACAITEMVIGKNAKEALSISSQDVLDALGGLPPDKVHCAEMAEACVKTAIKACFE
jgi:nitrogen fixation NifU-like protein